MSPATQKIAAQAATLPREAVRDVMIERLKIALSALLNSPGSATAIAAARVTLQFVDHLEKIDAQRRS
jgi:hypothetical protein